MRQSLNRSSDYGLPIESIGCGPLVEPVDRLDQSTGCGISDELIDRLPTS